MGKLIKNIIKDIVWTSEQSREFENLFNRAFEKYKTGIFAHNKSKKKKVKKSGFARYIRFFARENNFGNIQFYEKDIQRLKKPQKGIHTKHSFTIICVLLQYLEEYDFAHININDILKYIIETNKNIVIMDNLLRNEEILKERFRAGIVFSLEMQKDKIDYYIKSKLIKEIASEKNIK